VRLLTLGVFLLACGIYVPSLADRFVFDDIYIILQNPSVTGAAGLGHIFLSHYWAAQDALGDLYRPLTILSFRLNYLVTGATPWSYHLVNLLLHGAVTAVALRLLRRLTGSLAAAAAGAIVFATHPVHSEAVIGVVGRAELLAAVCVLSAWLCRDRPWLAWPLFACGLLSKENAIVLPGLLLAEDLVSGRFLRRVKRILPFLAMAILYLAARFAILGPRIGAIEGPFSATSVAERISTALDVFTRYLWLMIYPAKLSADYSFAQVPTLASPLEPGALAGAGCVLGILTLAWWARRRCPGVTLGIAAFLVALAPVGNFFFGIGVVMAERLLYLPSFGLCLAAGAGLAMIASRAARGRPRWVFGATVGIVAIPAALFGLRAAERCSDWADSLALFQATVRTSPRSALAQFGLGAAYQERGRWEEARTAYRRSLSIAPDRAETHYNLGTLYEAMGDIPAAIGEYEETVRLAPRHKQAYNNLGILHQRIGGADSAEADYKRAVEVAPESAAPAYNYAVMLDEKGRFDEAIRWYRRSLEIDPSQVMAWNNLGRLFLIKHQPDEAIGPLQRALRIDPRAPGPLVNLAAAWLAQGHLDRAARLLERVLRDHPDDAAAHRVLDALGRRRSAPH
ncbi:MAG: tetratricopeptide repeat protein, partial [Acidobacteriota bacterium]